MKRGAVFPGSFDPITNGHIDIIKRAEGIFDEIIVAVLENPQKTCLFEAQERADMIKEIFKDSPKVKVETFNGLLMNYMKKKGAKVVIRGLRAISDFEYEFQMALMNMKLNPEVETLFMMPSVEYSFLSSRLVKEVYSLSGCVKDLVPPVVEEYLRKKLGKR
ncbi:MAG: pantetheine-phosphate adenylyltransferase [Candidatus Aminicenantia bacterium]